MNRSKWTKFGTGATSGTLERVDLLVSLLSRIWVEALEFLPLGQRVPKRPLDSVGLDQIVRIVEGEDRYTQLKLKPLRLGLQ